MICIAGKNEIAIQGLLMTLDKLPKANVLVCPNQFDDGISRWQPSLLRFAKELGIRVCKLEELYYLKDLKFFSLEFDRIIEPSKFQSTSIFNIHFSKLPSYKGMYTSAWPLLNHEDYSGVTIHKIDNGIDTGEIIAQREFFIPQYYTARDLYLRYLDEGVNLLAEFIDRLIDSNYESIPQSSINSTYYSKKSIDYKKLVVDLSNTAYSISSQIRAYSFREFQLPRINGLEVSLAKISTERSTSKPGSLLDLGDNRFMLSTVDYNLELVKDRSFEIFGLLENNLDCEISTLADSGLLNITNKDGHSALMLAAYRGMLKFCEKLLENGANPKQVNQNGTTTLMYSKSYAEATGDFSLSELLIEYGVDPKSKDRFGKTVLDYAILNNEKRSINFFGRLS